MIDDFSVETLLNVKENIVIPTVYLLCITIIYSISMLFDSFLFRKESLLEKQKITIKMINIIILPVQFLSLYIGFYLLFDFYYIIMIYLPLIFITAFIGSIIKNLYIKKYLNLKMFGKIFFAGIISTLIWMLTCSILIILLAY